MSKCLEVVGLSKIFKGNIVAVDNISFFVNEKEIFGLLGPNGSGKTTTQRMLAMVLQPTAGKIKYGGRIVDTNLEKYKNRYRIGYIPQGDCLYKDLTVYENLDFFSRPYKLDSELRKKNIELLLTRLKLQDKRDTLVKNLSGGLAKRVSIAIALIHEPDILFLDEITMGLDPNSRYEIWNLLKDLKKTTSIIMTTHYMDEAETLCDRIAIMSKGKIVELDSPQNILKNHGQRDLNDVLAEIIKEENE